MTRPLDRAAILAYRDRAWDRLRDAKGAYWRATLARGGMAESERVLESLRRQVQALDPSWPTQSQREEDLQTHQRVARALARTAQTPGIPVAQPAGPSPSARRVR
jgi:hypothetical protein